MDHAPWLTMLLAALVLGGLGGAGILSLAASHTRLQLVMSAVGGFLVGIAGLHLLPHAIEQSNDAHAIAGAFVAGLVLVYLVLRLAGPEAHPQTHHDLPHSEPDHGPSEGHTHTHTHSGSAHEPNGSHSHDGARRSRNRLPALAGLFVHAVFDGLVLAAAFLSERETPFPGLAVFVAILVHKPLDLFATSVVASDRSSGAAEGRATTGRAMAGIRRVFTAPVVGLALVTPVCCVVAVALGDALAQDLDAVGTLGMAFGGGVLLCVALADVLPEVRFHGHDRVKLAGALLVGLAAAWGIAEVEHRLAHGHHHDTPTHKHLHNTHQHPH